MYQIYFNDYPLYDPRSDELQIREPDIHLAVDESGEMAFTIDSDHPHASRLTRLKGVLKLTFDGRPIFRGRIRKDTRDFYLGRRIEAEGLLACLNDSVIPPFDFPGDFKDDAAYQQAEESGNVIHFFLNWVVAQHNSQVGPDQQIELGDVTVADPNNYISRASSEYLTSMEVVRKKICDLFGGYLLADYSGDKTKLHYYADLPLTNVQEVEFGNNLLDVESEIDAADTYTAILPVGMDGLTIESLPNGEISPGIKKSGTVIYSEEAEEAAGGRIVRVMHWDDVTLADNLRTKATAELTANGIMQLQSIRVRAVDLGGTDTLPNFVVGRYVQFKSPPHGFNAAYPLMELEPNIFNPGDTVITLGTTIKAASDISHGNQSSFEEGQNKIWLDLNRREEKLTEAIQESQRLFTEAIQTSEAVIFKALDEYISTSDYEDFKQTVESQFSVMAETISMSFTQVTEQVKNVDGDLQKTVETLYKNFEFGVNGLAIKAGENAMSLVLDNDTIIFKKNGQQFGWWDGVDFHTGNIVVDVNERAQFGNFAFVPRSNGSLSFLKVGG